MSNVTIERLRELNPDAILFDELDAAIVGITMNGDNYLPVYDYERMIGIFVRQGMTYEESFEWVDFNVVGAYLGEMTPVIMGMGG